MATSGKVQDDDGKKDFRFLNRLKLCRGIIFCKKSYCISGLVEKFLCVGLIIFDTDSLVVGIAMFDGRK